MEPGKGLLFQSQRKAMPKNVQTILQLHSSHRPARSCSKSSQLYFSSMWPENFQMYKLDLEKAEEPEIKLPTYAESLRKQESSRKKIYSYFIDYSKVFDCVDYNKLCKVLREMGISDHLTWLLRNPYTGQEAIVRTGHGTTDWFQIGKGVHQDCILSPCLFNLYTEYIMQNGGLE